MYTSFSFSQADYLLPIPQIILYNFVYINMKISHAKMYIIEVPHGPIKHSLSHTSMSRYVHEKINKIFFFPGK